MGFRHAIQDDRGSSIIIALVFFLICAIIGSVVVTAASVEAKSVQTHKDLQQAEFTMSSAAQVIGYDLDSAELTVVTGADSKETIAESGFSQFGSSFWRTYGSEILQQRKLLKSFEPSEPLTITQGSTTVHGKLTVDPDLNIAIKLSLDQNLSPASPYNMTVNIQCIPKYDIVGKLQSFTYERAIITKTSGGTAS